MRSTLLVLVPFLALSGVALGGERLKWEPQLREMGYLFLHLSNINVINGLNLTREQAQKLRSLASEVEAAASPAPTLAAPLSPELEAVRKTWLEARGLLLDGKPVPPDLEARVNQARAAESAVIRKTIRPAPLALDTRCVSCHTAPDTNSGPPMARTPQVDRLVGRAHAEGLYGTGGLVRMALASAQVKSILTEGQQAILGSFSCCLVPPHDLSDPVRAGQAEGDEKALDLMRKIRQCPDGFWPVLRGGILAGVDRITDAVSPGATAARKLTTREEIAKLVDRVRSLKDVEFEMEKAELSKSVKTILVPGQGGDAPFKASYFLFIPGSSAVYARYLDRLAKSARADAQPK
jgi:hypothetical protein